MPIPTHALGLVAYDAGDVRVEPVPVRTPAPDEAVIEVIYGGICGSDLHYWLHGAAGQSILRDPMLLGHEVVGIVRAAAQNGTGPAAGTPVAVHPARPSAGDGTIRYPSDRPNLSPAGSYLGSAAHRPHTQGAFVRYLPLAADMLRPLDPALALRQAAVIEPASVAWHAVQRAGTVTGKRVLVVGAGPIGALVVAVLARAGAGEIVAVDLHPEPLGRATQLGATHTMLATDTAAVAGVDADIAIESSGSTGGLSAAISATTRGGRVVMLGLLPPGDQPVPVSLAIARELELVGSFRFNDEIDQVILAMQDGSLKVDAVITHEYDIKNAVKALETATNPALSGKVLLTFNGSTKNP